MDKLKQSNIILKVYKLVGGRRVLEKEFKAPTLKKIEPNLYKHLFRVKIDASWD